MNTSSFAQFTNSGMWVYATLIIRFIEISYDKLIGKEIIHLVAASYYLIVDKVRVYSILMSNILITNPTAILAIVLRQYVVYLLYLTISLHLFTSKASS